MFLTLHREQSGLNKQTMQIIGVPLLESMQKYQEGNYEKAVHLLYPVRYEMWRLGGSEAQVSVRFTSNCPSSESKNSLRG